MGCGCKKARKFGNVNEHFEYPEDYEEGCSVRG